MEFQGFNFKISVSLLLSIHKKLIGILIAILQVYQLQLWRYFFFWWWSTKSDISYAQNRWLIAPTANSWVFFSFLRGCELGLQMLCMLLACGCHWHGAVAGLQTQLGGWGLRLNIELIVITQLCSRKFALGQLRNSTQWMHACGQRLYRCCSVVFYFHERVCPGILMCLFLLHE